jgi:CDP-paratose 2-epimerase
MRTGVFRGGCLTGPGHSGAELHGFLSYLMQCARSGAHNTVFGYRGKQVRDNIHCADLVNCSEHFGRQPRAAEVCNMAAAATPTARCSKPSLPASRSPVAR